MSPWALRKRQRTLDFYRWVYGWVLVPCTACSGSGRYDSNGSPPCGACDGAGRTRERGPKALTEQQAVDASEATPSLPGRTRR